MTNIDGDGRTPEQVADMWSARGAPDKLAGIKPGDTVEVTFRGVVKRMDDLSLSIKANGGDPASVVMSSRDILSPHFAIKRIEPELKVGDRVRIKGQDAAHEVLRIVGHQAVILTVDGDPFADVYPLSDLERIP